MPINKAVAVVSARQHQREAYYLQELEALTGMVQRLREDFRKRNIVHAADAEKMAAWSIGIARRAGEITELRILVEDLARE